MKTQIHSTIFDIQVSGVAVLFEKYSSSLSHVPPLLMPYASVLFRTTIVVPERRRTSLKIAQQDQAICLSQGACSRMLSGLLFEPLGVL